MKKWLIETPVFLTFFVRYQTLERVFEVIKEVRPKTLFLVGDGPRPGRKDDIQNISKCKEILETIDWDCDVHRYYAENNRGILLNSYEGQKRAFQIVDRLICLEDDMLPTKSFFYFCEELLEKYKDDQRIQCICGMNLMEIYDKPNSDYFFARHITSGALATWKRTFYERDFKNDYLEDPYALQTLVGNLPRGFKKSWLRRAKKEREEHLEDGKPKSGELAFNMNHYLYHKMDITPTKNMVVSIGVMRNSAHAVEDIRMMPKSVRQIHQLNTYDYQFPLNHPKYMVCDQLYEKMCRRRLAAGHPYILFYRRIITFFLIARYGGLKKAFNTALVRLKTIFSSKSNING